MTSQHHHLEEGTTPCIDFSKVQQIAATGLHVIPAVAQDVDSGEVLMLAYVNAEALAEAQRLKVAVFFSTSRNALWIKGASSGSTLELLEIRVNCEQNSILYRVRAHGRGACHTQRPNGDFRSGCFYRALEGDTLRFMH